MVLFNVRLDPRIKVQQTVGADADSESRCPRVLQQHDLLDEVVGQLIDQFDFEERLTADEFQNTASGILGAHVLVRPIIVSKDHIDESLADVEGHGVPLLLMLIAVGAAEVAVLSDLERDVTHMVTVEPDGLRIRRREEFIQAFVEADYLIPVGQIRPPR